MLSHVSGSLIMLFTFPQCNSCLPTKIFKISLCLWKLSLRLTIPPAKLGTFSLYAHLHIKIYKNVTKLTSVDAYENPQVFQMYENILSLNY